LGLALIAVASVFAFLAIFSLWANRQLLNTDNWTSASSQLLEKESIKNQLSGYLTDQVYANVDVQGQLRAALPPQAAPLAGPAAGGLKQLLQKATFELLGRPRVQGLWEEANRRAHANFLKVVEGGGPAVSTANGKVVLDVKALLGQTEERAGVGGRAQEKIPEGAGQITIMESDQLGLAQDLVNVLKALPIVLLALMLGLFALGIRLARGWRREALRACGFGLLAAGAAALVARSLAGGSVVDALAKTEAVRPAVEDTWSVGTSLLVEAATAAVAYGVVIIFATWLAGPTHAAVATRRQLAPYLREPRYAYGALAAIVLLLLAWGPTPATRKAVPALLLIALLAAGFEVLRRQTAREYPSASIEQSTRRAKEWLAAIPGRLRGDATPEANGDRLAELERLGRMRDSGVLDAGEFEAEKRRILGVPEAPAGA
jgi:hypothetical protein